VYKNGYSPSNSVVMYLQLMLKKYWRR